MKDQNKEERIKVIISNRKARFEYEILDKYEAGMVLVGTEVKSVRNGKISLQESYATINKKGEVVLEGCTIQHYTHGNINNHEPTRPRVLLLHKKEIFKIRQKILEKGLTFIPLRVYFKGNKLKIELGIARGKKLFDKRETIKYKNISKINKKK